MKASFDKLMEEISGSTHDYPSPICPSGYRTGSCSAPTPNVLPCGPTLQYLERMLGSREENQIGYRRWCSCCAACFSFCGPIDLLCRACWKQLLSGVSLDASRPQVDVLFPVYSLWTWSDANDFFLRPLIYGLKGGRNAPVWRFLATEFAFRMGRRCQERGELKLVPAPSRSQSPDHATLWSRALAEKLGAQSLEILRIPEKQADSGAQKLRSAQARAKNSKEFQVDWPMRPAEGRSSYVFVDDVLASGATAQAACSALNKPIGYESWVLAYRPKAAQSEEIEVS